MKKMLFVLLLTLISFSAFANSAVMGNVNGEWTVENSPYSVVTDINLVEGDTLTIEPGVIVKFFDNTKFTVNGTLNAIGTEVANIDFVGLQDNESVTYDGITLTQQATGTFDYCNIKNAEKGIAILNSTATITNSNFNFNDTAIHPFMIYEADEPIVEIAYNTIQNSVGCGILAIDSDALYIHDNNITGNGTGSQFKGAIQLQVQGNEHNYNPEIANNNIHDNHYQGITISDILNVGTMNPNIHDNTITGNFTGVYFFNNSGDFYNNEVTNNFVEGNANSGAGIMCYGAGATPYIYNNTITGNYGGIYLMNDPQPIIGDNSSDEEHAHGMNTIANNVAPDGNSNSIILNQVATDVTIMAQNNLWGTEDLEEIAATITDHTDNEELGTVTFDPIYIEITDTQVAGEQSGTWSLENSPYLITDDITVPENETLVIEAGVTVKFAADTKLISEGTIIAEGTEEYNIIFRAQEEDSQTVSHKGILLKNETNNIFTYCKVSNGEKGISILEAGAEISHCTFEYNDNGLQPFMIAASDETLVNIHDNLVQNNTKSGILIIDSNAVKIHNNEVTGNGTGPQFRGAIQIQVQGSESSYTPEINDNNIHDNHYQGITVSDMLNIGTLNPSIHNNTISGNFTGVYFYNTPGDFYDNQVINNFVEGNANSGAGIMCYGAGATPYIYNNTITGNYGGIYLMNDPQPIIGDNSSDEEYAQGMNTIENNVAPDGNTNSVILNQVSTEINIMAQNNLWGTEDLEEIAATITDHTDNEELGTVTFDPIYVEITDTQVAGEQSGTWSLENSPYLITADVTVPENETLVIEAGVTVKFAVDTKLISEGTITANGSEDNYIVFRAEAEIDTVAHKGILLKNETNNSFSYCKVRNGEKGISILEAGAEISNCTFEYNDNGVQPFMIASSDEPLVNIHNNLFQNNTQSAILVIDGDAVKIDNNDITGNGTGPQFRGAIQIQVQGSESSYTPEISNNNIHNNHYQGITVSDMLNIGTLNPSIHNNTITGNFTGVYFYNNSGDFYDNQVINNFVEGNANSGAGIMCYGAGATPYIYNNTITGNYGGIYLMNDPQPVIGDNSLEEEHAQGMNTIANNVAPDGNTNSIILNQVSAEINIMAQNNLWGTEDLEEIAATITDHNDNEELGTVIFSPFHSDNNDENVTPVLTSLVGNYPNPFNPTTTIKYTLKSNQHVTLNIYNVRGQKVKTLINENQNNGSHSVVWNGKDNNEKTVSSGVYFYKMITNSKSQTKKMILMK